ncbi:MAG TPA: 4Fe-4S dicluster domain-containing protein [Chlorobaculum parvum]|uniref:4Fe-4S dicluster domain-containing protein n=1 Tax=Chlorobaculum parvum TaxID=274539 RepID=A0A7C5DIR9_9CHLB|nr:4Fe-4S dicluster domain-containing protein [Chlorobaculum parvum]
MIDFNVDSARCTRCGQCVADCPSRIIVMRDHAVPSIAPEKERACLRCEHCLAVCPEAALSILGFSPDVSTLLKGHLPEPDQLETLIAGRRSVRRYRSENLSPELIDRLIAVAFFAPTGVNTRKIRFTVLDDREKTARFRDEVMNRLVRLLEEGAFPESKTYYARFVKVWEKHKIDLVFRDAPHLLVVTAPKSLSTPREDCVIALTTFELYAQACGIGTLWNGIATWAIEQMLPEMRQRLGIPDDHAFGYAMLFGKPAVHYARTVQHHPPEIYRVP